LRIFTVLISSLYINYWMLLYAFFWVHPRRLNFICRRFETICSIFIPTRLWRWNRQSIPKCRHIKFSRRGITQNEAYNIQNKAKVWNQEYGILITSKTTDVTTSLSHP